MYQCPNCGAPIRSHYIEDFAGGSGCDATQRHSFACPACSRSIEIQCEIQVEYTLEGDGKDAEEYDPTLIRLAPLDNRMRDPVKFSTMRPKELFMTDDPMCTVCGSRKQGCRCAADLLAANWRVVQEFPGLRATCPDCYGG